MNPKSNPVLSSILYILCGLNLCVMIACIFMAANYDAGGLSEIFNTEVVFGTLLRIFVGLIARSLHKMTLVFVVSNTLVSLALFTAAHRTRPARLAALKTLQLDSCLDSSISK